ncbi:MAG: TonB-dependent receptor [Thermoanaerobaculia bacterium]|nr:TonB-dependent receptor [Thermoanaerobaculia bacterium]
MSGPSGCGRRKGRTSRTAFRCPALALALLCAPPARAQEKSLDELLRLSLQDLAAIEVVSAAKVPATAARVPATVRVITAEAIAENGYLTLEDALADLPGFQLRNILGFNAYTFLRGVPSQNSAILLLVDGIQVNELNSGGFYAGGQLNLANVERIEVVYGPASALYGTNALSGIVNVIRKDPGKGTGGKLNASLGSLDTSLFDVRYAWSSPGDDLAVSVAGMRKRTDKADLRGDRGDGNWTDAADNFENDLSLDGLVRWKGLSVGFLVQDKEASRASVQKTLGEPLRDDGVGWHIRFLNAWAAYVFELPDPWSARSTVYVRSSTVEDDTVPVIERATATSPGSQQRWYRPGELVGAETQATWAPTKRFTVSAGLVLERERLSRSYSVTTSGSELEPAPTPPEPERVTNDLASLYAEAQVGLTEQIRLFAGLRHDDATSYGTVDTPRAGLVLNRSRFSAKLLYMEAFRAPKPWDLTDGLGNPDLRPEEMRMIEASAAYSFSPHLQADVSVYRSRLDERLTRSGEGTEWRWVNAGELETRGVEVSVELRKGRTTAWANASLCASEDETGRQVAEIARTGANAGIRYAVTRGATLGLRASFVGSRRNPKVIPETGDDRIEDALVLRASAALTLPHGLEARLFVDNLGGTTWFHPSNLPPSRYRQPGRTFRVQAGWSF